MLSSLEIENFRNYRSLKLNFNVNKPMTVIYGLNGQGKSNLIESLYLLSITKSFRESDLSNIVSWGENYLRAKALLKMGDKEKEIEFFYQSEPKKIKNLKINNVKLGPKNFWGNLKVVLFSPENLEKFFLEPAERRKYLDILISQVDKDYFEYLRIYNKVKDQKTALLGMINEGRGSKADLDYWNNLLVKNGMNILLKRREIIGKIKDMLSTHHQNIFKIEGKLEIAYKSDIMGEKEELEGIFRERLLEAEKDEINSRKCLVGPHKDDIILILNKRDIKSFGSRGEKRSAFLSLKKAEIDLLEENSEMKAVLLIDDFFSEFDEERKLGLIELTRAHQSIITTLSLKFFENIGNKEVFEVKNGLIDFKVNS